MKKRTIWIITIVMGLSFIVLLFMQLTYISQMVNMKKEQFDESVNRALYQASRNLELNETLRYLEKDINAVERKNNKGDSIDLDVDGPLMPTHQSSVARNTDGYTSFQAKTMMTKPSQMPKAMILHNDKKSNDEASKTLQEIVKNRYVYQKALLDEVVLSII